KIFGGPAIDAVSAVGNVVDQLFTSDDERAQAALLMEKLRQQPQILQAEINRIEASHRSLFVAGWRPFIGWVCGLGFLWAFILHPLFLWVVAVRGMAITPPEIMTDNMMELVLALLGLGTLRSVEKMTGRSK
ncbi:MAG: holin family protein, partial [Emcibacter sp.]|nr:holin family protein [Emcibacter sp.]